VPQNIMFLNASATLLGILADAKEPSLDNSFVETLRTWFRLERLPWARTSWYQNAAPSLIRATPTHSEKWVSMNLRSKSRSKPRLLCGG
jgi:hypothetical protein